MGRTPVLDYLKLIQDLVHFLEVIHNIWIISCVLFLHSLEGKTGTAEKNWKAQKQTATTQMD